MIAMLGSAALVALVTLAVGLALAYLLRLLPTVRLQLAGLAFLAAVRLSVNVWVIRLVGCVSSSNRRSLRSGRSA